MSCYLRHISDVLGEAGIEVTPANRKQIDQAIHQMVDVHYKDCPTAWKKLKQDVLTNDDKRRHLVAHVREALSG
ncbi:MAG: hypothetical protein SVP26_06390 [Chloroflexota bacterium]|nr:hypothetical protein [Chloroflexota bacterium]